MVALGRRSRVAGTPVAVAVALLVAGCTAGTGDARPFEGLWVSEGFGLYLEASRRSIDVFEHTAVSCGRVAGGSDRGSAEVLSLDPAGRLVLEEPPQVIRFDRLEVLPEECRSDYWTEDPPRNFEVLAATMEEHYAFFEARDPGWEQRRAEVAAGIGPGLDDAGLLAAAVDLLGPLQDAQVRIAPDDPNLITGGAWSAGAAPDWVEELAVTVRAGEVPGIAEVLIEEDGGVVSGELAGGVGYVALTRLAGFAPDPDEEELLLAAALTEPLARFDDAVVLDLRVNRGGREALAMLVASRFLPVETLVATRTARVGGTDRYVDSGDVVVRPLATGTYPGRLVVLVGPGTAGAAELLALALRHVPWATLVGEPTAGSLSPLLVRALPNGWILGLSHQRVLDADGVSWEGRGISVDVESGPDDALDAALGILGA